MTEITADGLVADYLRRLDAALGRLPAGRRRQLVAEITEHVEEARAQLVDPDEVTVRDLLDRIGRPEDIAAAALADGPDRRRIYRRLAWAGAVAVVLAGGVGTAVAFEGHGTGTQAAGTVAAHGPVAASHGSVVTSTSAPAPTSSTTAVATTAPPRTSAEVVVAAAPAIRSGIYVNGPSGTPHYFVSLTDGSAGQVSGSVDFLYQDGQTGVAFSVTGNVHNGVMTLYPANVQTPPGGTASLARNVPSVISATVDRDAFDLGECSSYLSFVQSLADCAFTYSATGPAGPSR